MITTRLDLQAFKAKAESVNTNEILEKVQGGRAQSECHGVSTQWGKAALGIMDFLGY